MNLGELKEELIKILEDKIIKLQEELNNIDIVSDGYKSIIHKISILRNLMQRISKLNFINVEMFLNECKYLISNNKVILELGELERNKVIEKIELYNSKKREMNFSLDIPNYFNDIEEKIKNSGIDKNSIKELKEINYIIDLFVEKKINLYNLKERLFNLVNMVELHYFDNIENKIKNNIVLTIEEINEFKKIINKYESPLFDNLIQKTNKNIEKDKILTLQNLIYKSFLVDIEEIEKFLNIKIDFNISIEERILNIISEIDKVNENINIFSKKIISIGNMFNMLENQRKKDLNNYGVDINDLNLEEVNEYNIYKIVYLNEIYNYILANYNVNRRKI